jgi:predicted amidohydrolase YtcJ
MAMGDDGTVISHIDRESIRTISSFKHTEHHCRVVVWNSSRSLTEGLKPTMLPQSETPTKTNPPRVFINAQIVLYIPSQGISLNSTQSHSPCKIKDRSCLLFIFVHHINFSDYTHYITIFDTKGENMLIYGAKIYNPQSACYDDMDMRFTEVGIEECEPWGILQPQNNEFVIKGDGLFLYPGFIDSHCHLMGTGEKYLSPSLIGVQSSQQLKHIIFHQLQKQSAVSLRGWDEEILGFIPTRKILDTYSNEPIILIRKCGHIATVNSAAIRQYNLATLDGKDETSIKEGIICENALLLLREKRSQDLSFEKECLIEGAKKFQKHGVTSVHSEDWNPKRLQRFVDHNVEKIPCRLFEKISIQNLSELTEWIQLKESVQKASPKNIDVSLMIKLYMDGSIGGRTAYLSTPYKDTGKNGVQYYSVGELRTIIECANNSLLQICIHTIGDWALKVVLESFLSNPHRELRHRIIHAQFASNEQIQQLKDGQFEISIQPCFYQSDLQTVTKLLDQDFISNTGYPFKQIAMQNLLFSLSTDSPVESENPFHNMWHAENYMPRKKAFYAYTIAGARQVFQENMLGQLKKGYKADFFVLKKDLFTIPKEDLLSIQPYKVFFDGKEVVGDQNAGTI